MEREFNLRNVHHVRVQERVDAWEVRGERESGSTSASSMVEYRKDEEQDARDQAAQWCKDLGFSTYVVQRFTGKPYIVLLTTIDVETGGIVEEHTEDWN